MFRWILGWAVMLAAVGAMAITCSMARRSGGPSRVVDSLTTVNSGIAAKNQILLANVAELTTENDRLKASNDSLKVISDAVTQKIRDDRAKLPAADAVTPSNFRELYAAGLKELDRAISELGRKDDIIRGMKAAQARSDSIAALNEALIANLSQQRQNDQAIIGDVQTDLAEQVAENQKLRGQQKVWVTVGAGATILTAVILNQLLGLVR